MLHTTVCSCWKFRLLEDNFSDSRDMYFNPCTEAGLRHTDWLLKYRLLSKVDVRKVGWCFQEYASAEGACHTEVGVERTQMSLPEKKPTAWVSTLLLIHSAFTSRNLLFYDLT